MIGQTSAIREGRRQAALAARAFTVLELLIVMSILVTLMAVTWPALRRPLNRSQTLEAARQLARDVAQARILAIQRGETLVMRFQPGGRKYQIEAAESMLGQAADDTAVDVEPASLDDSQLPDLAGDAGSSDMAAPDWDQPLPELEPMMLELPVDVTFTDPTISDQTDELEPPADQPPSEPPAPDADSGLGPPPDDPLEMLEQMDDAADAGNWSRPILFFPTGRSESVSFRLAGVDGYWVTVTLRGMTGAVDIGPLQHTLRTSPARETEPNQRAKRQRTSNAE